MERRFEADRIFAAALDLPPAERDAYVAGASAGDPELEALVRRLLASAELVPTEVGLGPGPLMGDLLAELSRREAPVRGTVVGRYRLLDELGRGGMAVVYRAERADGQFQQVVAVKVMQRGLPPEGAARFELERSILARLRHPGIAQLFDGGVDGEGRPYLVTEYVPGRHIDRYCDEERLPVARRLELFLQVARAVEAAHRNLVVHRDLKPTNILVTDEGYAKLLDFGIAKVVDGEEAADPGLTRTGRQLLTPVFASPEQMLGRPVTTASDVYQLGLLLYLLLAGRFPYRLGEGTPAEILHAACEQEATRPSSAVAASAPVGSPSRTTESLEVLGELRGTSPQRLRRLLAGDLDNILLTALRKEPERRYASVAQLIGDLESHLAGRPVAARPDTFAYRLGKFARRHRTVVATGAAAALLLLGLGVFHVASLARERDRAQAAAAEATQIAGFLRGLFEVSAPTRSKGEQVTAREMLDRGAGRIEAELAGQPRLAAEMMALMGEVYRELALYEEAEPLLEKALALRREAPGEARLGLAEALHAAARLAEDQGELEAARQGYGEALALREAALGPDDPEVGRSLSGLGRVEKLAGDFAAARRHQERALAVLRAGLGPGHPEVGLALKDLGDVLQELGEFEPAKPLLTEALEILRRHHEPDHPHVAGTRLLLGHVLRFTGDEEGARAQYETALPSLERAYGPDHPEVAVALTRLGLLENAMDDFPAAAAHLERALAIRREAFGPRHPSVAQSYNNLGLTYWKDRRIEEAKRAYEQAVAVYEAAVGPEHVDVARALQNLGSLLHGAGRPAEALPIFERAVAIRENALGPEHPHLSVPLHYVGILKLELGRQAEAEQPLRRALRLGRGEAPFLQAERFWPRLTLGRCLTALGRRPEAEALLAENLAEPEVEGQLRRQTLEALVGLYQDWGRGEEAAERRRELAALQEAEHPAGEP